MGYIDNECAYCYARGYDSNPLDDSHEQYVCSPCIGKLVSMNDGGRFMSEITKDKSYGDECFLCGYNKNSMLTTVLFNVTICQEHENIFKKSNYTGKVSDRIFVLMENGTTIVEAFRSRECAEDKILNKGNPNLQIIDTNLK